MFEKDIGSFYKKKIYILPNGLLKSFPEKEKKSDPYIHVLYLSNLYESKGIFTLLRAIPRVLVNKRNVKFLIAGPWQGEKVRKNVIDYVMRNKISANVEFLGAVYGQQKEELFLKSDIFVFPSHYPLETFGLVNLEAMQAGIPVITTNLGAMPEIVKDGQTGFIIPPKKPNILAEKINLLVKDLDLRKRMGLEGKKRFNAMYSFDAYSLNVQGILNDLL
ncbi:MAG: glycosyltransferase family 4 protein [Candidatus Aminicenantes bacterium]|nr:glycosyltransferase family 4 protein [Candidatus Aminicenantes bacterium]